MQGSETLGKEWGLGGVVLRLPQHHLGSEVVGNGLFNTWHLVSVATCGLLRRGRVLDRSA